MADLLTWFFVCVFAALAWQGIKLLDFLVDRGLEDPDDAAARRKAAKLAKDPEHQYRLARRATQRAEHEYWDIQFNGVQRTPVSRRVPFM